VHPILQPAVAFGLLVGLSAPAAAHIQLRYPTQRTGSQKAGPCGAPGSVRGPAMTLAPGSTIDVDWDETIDHDGHYRISFDADGHDFSNPATGLEVFPETLENEVVDRVVDGDLGPGNDGYTFRVTLPNITCDNCTLQLIQVMKAAPPYAASDLYFQCADLVLAGAPAVDAGPDDGSSDAGPGDPGAPGADAGGACVSCGASGGCAAAPGAGAGIGILAATLAALWLARRRAYCTESVPPSRT
jgi:hypothetical protein